MKFRPDTAVTSAISKKAKCATINCTYNDAGRTAVLEQHPVVRGVRLLLQTAFTSVAGRRFTVQIITQIWSTNIAADRIAPAAPRRYPHDLVAMGDIILLLRSIIIQICSAAEKQSASMRQYTNKQPPVF